MERLAFFAPTPFALGGQGQTLGLFAVEKLVISTSG
jgi:hypothetical protein